MDHSEHMSHMEHAGHAEHSMMNAMSSESRPCRTPMLFTWQSEDLCLVFEWWHIQSGFDFILSICAVVLLSMGYEYFRIQNFASSYAGEKAENETLPGPASSKKDDRFVSAIKKKTKVKRALIYGFQVLYSFFLMLLFMSYNAWIMLAIAAGASLGHYLWSGRSDNSRRAYCH
ncbi:Ctr copper transporter family-domain-containing protein [Dipodascopsis uninucleata]